MPLVNADVKGLEVVVAADLSGDRVLRQELVDGVDIHEANRDRFKLGVGKPGRLIAKIFKFRLIYGGSAYSYANDADFMGVSTSEKFWQGVIDEYYTKYSGIYSWHKQLELTAKTNGFLEIPSGRVFPITPDLKRGFPRWPSTIIKNYPVQGFGADLVKLARIDYCRRLRASRLEAAFISTIHDSLVSDTPGSNVSAIARMKFDAIAAVPRLCKEVYGYEFSLPLTSEVQVGMNKRDMLDFTDF